MTAWTGFVLIATGFLLGLAVGYPWAARDERKYRRRADWRCDQLIKANEQLRQERDELNEFLSVVTPEDWSA